MRDVESEVSEAVRRFWKTRRRQQVRQARSGKRDQGSRGSATGGGQLDGFADLIHAVLRDAGVPEAAIYQRNKQAILPGFFRPTKLWDLVVVLDGALIASIEFKSQVGSFGNNFNNRTEEAIGSATDLWTAYREGVYERLSPRPWLGWFMVLEDAPGSTTPVRVDAPHFPVVQEFQDASYADRYTIFCRKLVRERLYDATCLILTNKKDGPRGKYREPAADHGAAAFAASLTGCAIANLGGRGP